MKLKFDENGAAIPAHWTDEDVRRSQEETIRDILRHEGEPMTGEQIVAKAGGMAEVYIRETVARLQAKWEVIVLGNRCYLFNKEEVL